MPARRIAYFIPRQTSVATVTTTPSLQASTIATSVPPTTLPTIPGTTINDPASSSTSSEPLSLSSAQPTSSQHVDTTSTTTTSSQSDSSTLILTSDIRISSTSPNVLSSTFTSQQSISSPSSTPSVSSSPPPTSSSSPAPSTPSTYIIPPTSANRGLTTSYITSSYVTVIGTSTITTATVIPTTISSDVSNNSAGNRTAIIAGSVIGVGLLLIFILSVFFYRQRQRFKRFHSLDIMDVHRRQARARATLLAGEDLDDLTLSRPPPGRYTDYDNPWDPRDSSGSLGDSQRGIVDPLIRGADVDLSHIVDDVMGPSTSRSDVFYYHNSVSSSYRDFQERDETMIGGNPQTRELNNASQIALLEAAGLTRPTPSSPSGKPEGDNDAVGAGIDTGSQL